MQLLLNLLLHGTGDAGSAVKQLLAYFYGPVVLSKGIQDAGLYKPPTSVRRFPVLAAFAKHLDSFIARRCQKPDDLSYPAGQVVNHQLLLGRLKVFNGM